MFKLNKDGSAESTGTTCQSQTTLDAFFFVTLQADTPSDTHSLHITVSTYQKNAWIDFMEKVSTITSTKCSSRELMSFHIKLLSYSSHTKLTK